VGEIERKNEIEIEKEREREEGVSENKCLFEGMLKCGSVEVYVLLLLFLKKQKLKKRLKTENIFENN